jgi:hypothetical protein
MMRKALIVCGIVSSLYYVAVNVYVPTQWDEYSVASQTVRELSAIDAPDRVGRSSHRGQSPDPANRGLGTH